MDNNAQTQINAGAAELRAVAVRGDTASGNSTAVAVSQPVSEATDLISMIERAARDPAVDLEKFERLMDMKMRIEADRARKAYAAAISDARSQIKPVMKNRTVQFDMKGGGTKSYRHEDLAEIARTIDPALKSHGLSYRFRSAQSGSRVSVTCIISHRDGYSEETTLEAGEDHSGNKNSIQAIGSVATYLQRYTLKLALGIAASADDDGSGSSTVPASPVTQEEFGTFRLALADKGVPEDAVCEMFSVECLDDLTRKQFDDAVKRLQRTKARAKS